MMNAEWRDQEALGPKKIGMEMKRVLDREEKAPRKLSARNYFEVMSSLLFSILGLIILIRSIAETGLILGIGVGAAFLAYGIFRLRHIWNYFVNRGQKL
jgi:hypothetical protein